MSRNGDHGPRPSSGTARSRSSNRHSVQGSDSSSFTTSSARASQAPDQARAATGRSTPAPPAGALEPTGRVCAPESAPLGCQPPYRTEDSELMVDPESTEDLHSPDTQTDGLDSSSVLEEDGEDFSSTSWSTYNPYRIDAEYDHGGGRIIAPWLVPWKDGFLQVGHPMIDDGHWSESRFFFRFSADGLEWTDFDALDVPREHLSQPLIVQQDDHQIEPRQALPVVATEGSIDAVG